MSAEFIAASEWRIDELLAAAAKSGDSYLPFHEVPSLYTGIYRLEKGKDDPQAPHDHDELYYVVKGRGKLIAGEQDWVVAPGSLLFVAAHVEHHFFDIEEDLEILVFFSTGKTQDQE